jgi:hypothetical protein
MSPMLIDRPTDGLTHTVAMGMARDMVRIFSGILMDHEKPAALTEAYQVSREWLEKYEKRKEGK